MRLHLHFKIPRENKASPFGRLRWVRICPTGKAAQRPCKQSYWQSIFLKNCCFCEAILCALVWEFPVRSPPAAHSGDIMDYLTMRTCSPGTWPTCRHWTLRPGSPRLDAACRISCRKLVCTVDINQMERVESVSEHHYRPHMLKQTGRMCRPPALCLSRSPESFLQSSCKISELMFSIKVASEVRLYPRCVNQP